VPAVAARFPLIVLPVAVTAPFRQRPPPALPSGPATLSATVLPVKVSAAPLPVWIATPPQ
jgi:hypothetical protein